MMPPKAALPYPYLVIYLMPAYFLYRRIEILEHGEKPKYSDSFIFYSGADTCDSENLIHEAKAWSISEGRRCCIVFGPDSCAYIEPDGLSHWSSDVPWSQAGAIDAK